MSRLPRTITPVPQVPRLTTEAYNDGILRTAARVAYTVDSSCAAAVVSDKPVVEIIGTSGNQSRDQFRQVCIEFGTTYDTVEELPFDLDTSQATNLLGLFDGCSNLTAVSKLDTSSVTNMGAMFNRCSSLTAVPELDTSSVTNMGDMFYGCSSLTAVPELDTSSVTNMSTMFSGCSSLAYVPDLRTSSVTFMLSMFEKCSSLTDGNVRLIGKHPSVFTNQMIAGSGLTRLPFYDEQGNPI